MQKYLCGVSRQEQDRIIEAEHWAGTLGHTIAAFDKDCLLCIETDSIHRAVLCDRTVYVRETGDSVKTYWKVCDADHASRVLTMR